MENTPHETAADRPRITATTGFLLAVAGVLATALLVFGYMNSIPNVKNFAYSIGFAAPLEGALVVELGIPALLLLDFAFVLRGHSGPWFRVGAWLLAGAVVVMNAFAPHTQPGPGKGAQSGSVPAVESGSADWQGQLFYALMPTVPILVVEGIRLWAMLETRLKHPDSAEKMDRIRRSRWLASPMRTPKLAVRMVRWEITSYREAVLREQAWLFARSVASAELRRRGLVGRFTRAKAAWKKAPDLLRDQLTTGTLPIPIVAVLKEALSDPRKDWQWYVATWIRTEIRDHCATESGPESAPQSGQESGAQSGPESAVESGSPKAIESGLGAVLESGLGAVLESGPEAVSWADPNPDPQADPDRTRSRTRRRTQSAPKAGPKTGPKIVLGRLPSDPWEAAKIVNARYLEATERPVSAENLRRALGIAKGQANELVRLLRQGDEEPSDGAVRAV